MQGRESEGNVKLLVAEAQAVRKPAVRAITHTHNRHKMPPWVSIVMEDKHTWRGEWMHGAKDRKEELEQREGFFLPQQI